MSIMTHRGLTRPSTYFCCSCDWPLGLRQ